MRRLLVIAAILTISLGLFSGCSRSEVQSKPVEYKDGDLTMKGYLASDSKKQGKRPGILIVHEWWGQDNNVRKRADMLAEMGYTALAVDMYGNGKKADTANEAAEFAKEVSQNRELQESRFNSALNLLKQLDNVDPERIAAIGYSFGGHVVLEMARRGADLDGVVSIYGGLTTNEPAELNAIKARVLVLHGEKDWYVTVQNIAAFKSEMTKSKTDYQLIEYKEAEHGFANPDADALKDEFKMHLGYNKEADKKSWEDMQLFFKKIFK